MNPYELIIFDLDGTLADLETGELLRGVNEWFSQNLCRYAFAIATNQGGVGLRHWMETGQFGEPEKYPTEQDVWKHIYKVVNAIFPDGEDCWVVDIHVCFAYQSRSSGKWSPMPDKVEHEHQWLPDNRKPEPGMLYRAMHEFEVPASKTLMVGDSVDDKQAAYNAGCDFQWAWHFFKRPEPSRPAYD